MNRYLQGGVLPDISSRGNEGTGATLISVATHPTLKNGRNADQCSHAVSVATHPTLK